ncbi:MAG: FecR domain-containing protein [Tepidisphaeraceae bacterium]
MARVVSFILVVLSIAASVRAFQDTRPAGVTQPTVDVEHLTATVTAVEGNVRVRGGEDEKWQTAVVGMTVSENAEFFTGPRSAVQFVIPPDHTITLDRLGTIKVLQAVIEGGKVKTQMGMKMGRALYNIEAAGREHESSISTPSSTLAVRGTRFIAYDQRPFRAQGISIQGRVQFRDFKKKSQFFGSRGGSKTVIDTASASAASYARGQTVVDPGIRLARSEGELPLVASLLSSGATIEFDYDKGIRVVRGGQVPQNDNELIPTLPGTFNFVLRWQGNTDLNIGVLNINPADNPGSQSLYPVGGLNTTRNGGEVPFDHRGGANGGIEVAFWNDPLPFGAFRFGSVHISGSNTPATFDVFRDGQRIDIQTPEGVTVPAASYLAGPINPAFGDGQAVGTVRIDPPAGKVKSQTAVKPTKALQSPTKALAALRIAGPAKTYKP